MAHNFSEFDFDDAYLTPSRATGSIHVPSRYPNHPLVTDLAQAAVPLDPTPRAKSILPDQVLPHRALHSLQTDKPNQGYLSSRHRDTWANPSASKGRAGRSGGQSAYAHGGSQSQAAARSRRITPGQSTPSINQVLISRSQLHLPREPSHQVVHPAVCHHTSAQDAIQAPILRVFIGPLTADWMSFSLRRRWRAYSPLAPRERHAPGNHPVDPNPLHSSAQQSMVALHEPAMAENSQTDMSPFLPDLESSFTSIPRSFGRPTTPRLPRALTPAVHESNHSRFLPSGLLTGTTSATESFHTAYDSLSEQVSSISPTSPRQQDQSAASPPVVPIYQTNPSSHSHSLLPTHPDIQHPPKRNPPAPQMQLDQSRQNLDKIQETIELPLQQSRDTTLMLSRVAPVAFRRDYCRPDVATVHYNEYTAPKCRVFSEKWQHYTCLLEPGQITFYRRSSSRPTHTIYLGVRTRLSLYSSLDNTLAITYFEEDSHQVSRLHYRRSIRHYYRAHQVAGRPRRSMDRQHQRSQSMNIHLEQCQRDMGVSQNPGHPFTPMVKDKSKQPLIKSLLNPTGRFSTSSPPVSPPLTPPHAEGRHGLPTYKRGRHRTPSNCIQACILRFPTAAEAKHWYRVLHCHVIQVTTIPRSIDLTCPTLSFSPFQFVKVDLPFSALPVALEEGSEELGPASSLDRTLTVPTAARFAVTGPATVWDVRKMAAFELIVESEWRDRLIQWIQHRTLGICYKRFDRIDWCISNLTDGWDDLDWRLLLESYRLAQLPDDDPWETHGEELDWDGSDESSSSWSERVVRDRNTRLNALPTYQREQYSARHEDPELWSQSAMRPGYRKQRAATVSHPSPKTPRMDLVQSTSIINSTRKAAAKRPLRPSEDGTDYFPSPSVHDDLHPSPPGPSNRSRGTQRPRRSADSQTPSLKSQRIAHLRDYFASTPQDPETDLASTPGARTPLATPVHLPNAPVVAPLLQPALPAAPETLPMLENAADHSVLSTYFVEQTHEMQLREYQHYPDAVVLPDGTEMAEPNPLEGYLLRRPNPKTYFGRYRQMFVMTFDNHLVCVSAPRAKAYIESTMDSSTLLTSHGDGPLGGPDDLERSQMSTEMAYRSCRGNPYANDAHINAHNFVMPPVHRLRQRRNRDHEPSTPALPTQRPDSRQSRRSAFVRLFRPTKVKASSRSDGSSASFIDKRSQRSVAMSAPPTPYRYHYSTHPRLATMLRYANGFFDLTQIRSIRPVVTRTVYRSTNGPGMLVSSHASTGSHYFHGEGALDSQQGSPRESGINSYSDHCSWPNRWKFWQSPKRNLGPYAGRRQELFQVTDDTSSHQRVEQLAEVPAVVQRETRFDIEMTNGAILRLQAPTHETMLEWIRRLQRLRIYWVNRLQADARHRAECARLNLGVTIDAQGCELDIPEWEQPRTYADPLIWNVCRPLGCRTITMCGYLFRKKSRHGTLKRAYFVLTRGYLIEFTPVQHASFGTLQPAIMVPEPSDLVRGSRITYGGSASGDVLGSQASGRTRSSRQPSERGSGASLGSRGRSSGIYATSYQSARIPGNGSQQMDPNSLTSLWNMRAEWASSPHGRWRHQDKDAITRNYVKTRQKLVQQHSRRHGFYPRVRVFPLDGCFVFSRFTDDVAVPTSEETRRTCRLYPDGVLTGDGIKDCVFSLWQPKQRPTMPQRAYHLRSQPWSSTDARQTTNERHQAPTSASTVGSGQRLDQPRESVAPLLSNLSHSTSSPRDLSSLSASSHSPLCPRPATTVAEFARAQDCHPGIPLQPIGRTATCNRSPHQPLASASPVHSLAAQALQSFPSYLKASNRWKEKMFIFRARSRTEMEQWVSAINHEIERLQYQSEARAMGHS